MLTALKTFMPTQSSFLLRKNLHLGSWSSRLIMKKTFDIVIYDLGRF